VCESWIHVGVLLKEGIGCFNPSFLSCSLPSFGVWRAKGGIMQRQRSYVAPACTELFLFTYKSSLFPPWLVDVVGFWKSLGGAGFVCILLELSWGGGKHRYISRTYLDIQPIYLSFFLIASQGCRGGVVFTFCADC